MKRNFIYFINPISGTNKKDLLLRIIQKRMVKENFQYQILFTNASADYEYLLQKIAEDHITDVVVCGGDGTISQIASVLRGQPVNIGIIPMGSGNGLAFAANIPVQPSRAMDIIVKGKAKPVDGLMINDRFSCMLCGLGFDAQVAHDFAKQSKRGLLTYVQQTIKNFSNAPAYPFEIELNNNTIHTNSFFISIANSNQFGNHVTIAPMASISDGLLDIVVVNNMSPSKLMFSMLKQVFFGKADLTMQKRFRTGDIQYFQTRELKISNPGMAPLHIDGDPAMTHEKFTISILDGAIQLLQP